VASQNFVTRPGLQFVQSGTGAVERIVESKLQDVVSAFDFMTEDEVSSVTTGTVNGVASFLDVTSALQAAINAAAGKQLILPPGIYHISSTLIIPEKSWLQGTGTSSLFPNFSTDWIGNRVPSWGYRATTIQYLNGHGTIFDTASDSRFDGLVIRNFLTRDGTDLIFNFGTHFKFTNCVVQQMDGLLPNDPGLTSGACLIDACQFTGCTRVVYGIFLDAKVLNSTFTSFTSAAFTISSGGGLNSFIGNRFDFCEGAAIRFLTNSRNNRVIGNNFDSHGGVALQFDQTSNKNIIANNHFWRCGRNESGDELDAFVELFASSNQYFVGNLFVRGTPDIGSAWNGPEYVIGLESCINLKNYFVGNTIDRNSCYNKNPIRDKLGNSTNCIDIDSIFIGDDSGGDIGSTALTLGRFMAKPTVCYITENKTITGFSAGFENLTLTGASSGLTFTNSGGTLALDRTSKIDNITYGGRFYYTQNDQQYADGTPSGFRSQGNWPVNTLIYYQTPTTSLGAIKTANGSPDTWETFARNTAEALDDYEVGTFTPTIIGKTTAGTGTYSVQIGRYIRIGKTVTVWIKLVWSAHTGTGNGEITGLPFLCRTVSGGHHPYAASVGYETNYDVPANTVLSAYPVPNETNIRFAQIGVGTQSGSATVTLDTSAGVTVSATYEIA
jgi:hypothetical protein